MTLMEYMAKEGLSAAQVAEAVGVSAEAVRLWCHGHRKMAPETAKRIEKLYGVPKHESRPDIWSAAEAA